MPLFDYLFGCRHSNYTFPRTIRGHKRPAAAILTGTYVCCLECGQELPYDLREMRVVASKRRQRAYIAAATSGALLGVMMLLDCGAIGGERTRFAVDMVGHDHLLKLAQ